MNFLILLSFNFILLIDVTDTVLKPINKYTFLFFCAVIIFIFPILGLLADSYFGRYRVISFCTKILWLGALLYSLMSLVSEYIGTHFKEIYISVYAIVFFVIAVSLGGVQANMMQFIIDQIYDTSSIISLH